MSPIWMLGDVTKLVTMAIMPQKQSAKHVPQWPNGLADALRRERPDLGPTELARLVKTNKQTIDRYIKGERKLPKPMAEKLAPIVKSTTAELLLVDTDLPAFEKVPLFSWVSAGKLAVEEGVINVDTKKHVIAADLPKGDWIALQVSGDSMDRVAPDGSMIFVNRADSQLKNDQFYVFALGTGEATFKRYRGGKLMRLQPFSTNPDHETILAPEDLRVVGRVRRVVTDLR